MSAFILGVIDAQIADCRATGDTRNVENLLEARSQIAELIAADQAYNAARIAWDVATRATGALAGARRCAQANRRFHDAYDRRIAALRKVQGGAA